MSIPILIFTISDLGLSGPILSSWSERSVDSLRKLRQKTPAVTLVRDADLDAIRGLEGVVDRGTKHKAVGLSRILLGISKIPLIDGDFRSVGQMRRSIGTLLSNASAKGDKNVYFVGVDPSLFDLVRSEAERHLPSEIRFTNRRNPGHSGVPKSGLDGAQTLLNLLQDWTVPDELMRRFVGESLGAQLVRQLVLRAAKVREPVLLQGSTGTGKEVVARAIHDFSEWRTRPFLAINCGAIPRDLFESELFGHEKGAFTGAAERRQGLWELADGGTLFLDEIGDLSPDHQVKILRALQEGAIRRVGGRREIKVDARVIAATNRTLFSMVKAGQFREDLYYRLRRFLIPTPDLSDHPADIATMAQTFWQRIVGKQSQELGDDLISGLESYGWPGNARELKAVLGSLHALFGSEGLGIEHLNAVFQLEGREVKLPGGRQDLGGISLGQSESLAHLQRADEVVRACEVTLRRFASVRDPSSSLVLEFQAEFDRHLTQLQFLTSEPLLFHSRDAFDAVHDLLGQLVYFRSVLEEDLAEALSLWRRQLRKHIRATTTVIFEQMEITADQS